MNSAIKRYELLQASLEYERLTDLDGSNQGPNRVLPEDTIQPQSSKRFSFPLRRESLPELVDQKPQHELLQLFAPSESDDDLSNPSPPPESKAGADDEEVPVLPLSQISQIDETPIDESELIPQSETESVPPKVKRRKGKSRREPDYRKDILLVNLLTHIRRVRKISEEASSIWSMLCKSLGRPVAPPPAVTAARERGTISLDTWATKEEQRGSEPVGLGLGFIMPDRSSSMHRTSLM